MRTEWSLRTTSQPSVAKKRIAGGTDMRDMKRSLAIALGLFTATMVCGCGSGTSAPPPPPPPPVSVSVSPTSASIQVNATQQFTATLQNDPSNKGVTWALMQEGASCSAECGTLSATSSASGTPITYTAPAAVPTNPSVSLTATSATDRTKSASATVTVTSPQSISVSDRKSTRLNSSHQI